MSSTEEFRKMIDIFEYKIDSQSDERSIPPTEELDLFAKISDMKMSSERLNQLYDELYNK
jgi:hypothetical protein